MPSNGVCTECGATTSKAKYDRCHTHRREFGANPNAGNGIEAIATAHRMWLQLDTATRMDLQVRARAMVLGAGLAPSKAACRAFAFGLIAGEQAARTQQGDPTQAAVAMLALGEDWKVL